MKILFWLLAIGSLPAGLFMSFVCFLIQGLGLSATIIGEIVCTAGMCAVIVSLVCMILGILRLRKGKGKQAVIFALAGLLYSAIILAGIFLDEAVDTLWMEKDIAERKAQMYGEDWNDPPVIEGIPKLYQEVLNEFYVVIRNEWPAEQLMDLGGAAMADYYGDASLEHIGFAIADVNGDGTEELLIGTTAPAEEGGTAVFSLYSNPDDPFQNLSSIEGEVYYIHAGEEAGICLAEIKGEDAAWVLEAEEGESISHMSYQEGAMDPANRMTLKMIPFSTYK